MKGQKMMYTNNAEIRNAMIKHGIPFWRISEKLQINEGTILRWMRKELSEERRKLIMSAINELKIV